MVNVSNVFYIDVKMLKTYTSTVFVYDAILHVFTSLNKAFLTLTLQRVPLTDDVLDVVLAEYMTRDLGFV